MVTAIDSIVGMDDMVLRGDVSGVIGSMVTHQDSASVQASGSDAMGSLTLDGKSSEVVQHDGMRVVVEAMDRFKRNVFVQRAAMKLLLNVCLAKDVQGMKVGYRVGVIPAVVEAMFDFPYDSIVQWVGSQIFVRLCSVDDDLGRMVYRSGGLLRLQKVWNLRKSWSVKRSFRRVLSAAIHHLQTFAKGGRRYEEDRAGAHSASSLGSVDTFAYSTDADDTALEESRRSSRASTAAAVEAESKAQVDETDVAELSEDEDEIIIEQKIRSNITSLLLKKGWRVGRHPFVPECMESLFNSEKEFDLHRLDEITQLYVPSRSNSRQGSRGASRGGSRGGSRSSSRASSRPVTTDTHRTTTPFFEPVDHNLKVGDRPMTRDRPVRWNEAVGMYVLGRDTAASSPAHSPGQTLGDLHISPMHSRQGSRQGTGTGGRVESPLMSTIRQPDSRQSSRPTSVASGRSSPAALAAVVGPPLSPPDPLLSGGPLPTKKVGAGESRGDGQRRYLRGRVSS